MHRGTKSLQIQIGQWHRVWIREKIYSEANSKIATCRHGLGPSPWRLQRLRRPSGGKCWKVRLLLRIFANVMETIITLQSLLRRTTFDVCQWFWICSQSWWDETGIIGLNARHPSSWLHKAGEPLEIFDFGHANPTLSSWIAIAIFCRIGDREEDCPHILLIIILHNINTQYVALETTKWCDRT